jgi:chromosome partitioning protein
MAHIISFANQKGGVGKTTSAFNTGWALNQLGYRILLVDNDPQGNLTSYSVEDENEKEFSIDELYVSKKPYKIQLNQLTSIGERDDIKLIPADSMLAGVEYYLMARAEKEFVLRNALGEIKENFDYIIIDNPPSLNLLTVNGLVASDSLLIPVQLEYFSLEGIVLLQKLVESLKTKNPHLKLLGIIPNMFDDRRKLNVEVLEILKKEFGNKVFNTAVHDSVKLAESTGHSQSILSYAPKSRAAGEFRSLAKEIVENA